MRSTLRPPSSERRLHARTLRVQIWQEPSGNAALAGRELSQTDVIQASVRLTAFARWLQQRGAAGTVDQLRSAVYVALLSGRTVQSLLPPGKAAPVLASANGSGDRADSSPATSAGPATGTGPAGWSALSGAITSAGVTSAAVTAAADLGWPQLTGSVNLTMPMTTWLGLANTPGEVAGHGPVDADTSRELADSMDPATRWCLTLTDRDGHPVAHACAGRGPAPPTTFDLGRPPPPGPDGIAWVTGLRSKLKLLETGDCSHARESGHYQPPRSLQHLVHIRQRTCSYPGCRRAS